MNNATITLVRRRDFLGGIFSAGAFALGARLVPGDAIAATGTDVSHWQPSVYLGIEPDGRVIIVAHRSEMGTGIRTALPMVVSEELEADWKRVKIEQAIGDKKYGSQDTDGSEMRWSFNDIRPDSFVWRGEVSHDGGKTWWLQEEHHMKRRASAQQ